MPYRSPFSKMGVIQDKLIIFADGSVALDGEKLGWIAHISITPRWSHSARIVNQPPSDHQIEFRIEITPDPIEPDAVYNLSGKKIGHLDANGVFTKIPTTP